MHAEPLQGFQPVLFPLPGGRRSTARLSGVIAGFASNRYALGSLGRDVADRDWFPSLGTVAAAGVRVFSRTAEYALRAVCVIAKHTGESLTTEQVAAATQVPPAYLSKVLQALSRAQIVLTQRGSGGGVRLMLPAEQVSVFDVINAVDPFRRVDSCPLGLAEHGVELCPMHSQLDEALETIEQTLRATTVGDLLDPSRRSEPRCRFPSVGLP